MTLDWKAIVKLRHVSECLDYHKTMRFINIQMFIMRRSEINWLVYRECIHSSNNICFQIAFNGQILKYIMIKLINYSLHDAHVRLGFNLIGH